MKPDGGELIAAVLAARGARFLFTLCGGHIAPILVGARRVGIRVIDVRDEANAVFAADAIGRLTGVPGVAAVTAGPGVANTITALKNAELAQSPLVLLGGAAATVLRKRGSLQDIDQAALLASCVKKVLRIRRNCDIVPMLEHAFDLALSGVPGPVFVECPIDLLYDEALVRRWYGIKSDTAGGGNFHTRLLRWYLDRHVNRMFACEPEIIANGPVPGIRLVARASGSSAGRRASSPGPRVR
ncbi:MAG: thiamine pyrophosphate-binding protein [Spirochaetota bacterium]